MKREILILGLATFLLYTLLGVDVFWKIDGQQLLGLYIAEQRSPFHVLYLPGLSVLDLVLSPLSLSPYRLALVFSALGSSVGVAFGHLGFVQLGLERKERILASLLVATCAPVLLFATVVEQHGPFFAGAGLTFCIAAWSSHRLAPWQGALLGLSTSISTAAHDTGILLFPLVAALLLSLRWSEGPRRRLIVVIAFAGLVQISFMIAKPGLHLLLGAPGNLGSASGMLTEHLPPWRQLVGVVPGILWSEWILPFFPMSLLVLAALRKSGTRASLCWLSIALAPYLAVAVLLIPFDTEFGAYLLPLAFWAAALCIRSLEGPRLQSLALTCVTLSLALAITQNRRLQAHHDRYEDFARAVHELGGPSRMFLFPGNPTELSTLYVDLWGTPFYSLHNVAALDRAQVDALVPTLHQHLIRQWDAGRRVFLTQAAHGFLSSPRAHPLGGGPRLVETLGQAYSLVPVDAGNLRFYEITRR